MREGRRWSLEPLGPWRGGDEFQTLFPMGHSVCAFWDQSAPLRLWDRRCKSCARLSVSQSLSLSLLPLGYLTCNTHLSSFPPSTSDLFNAYPITKILPRAFFTVYEAAAIFFPSIVGRWRNR